MTINELSRKIGINKNTCIYHLKKLDLMPPKIDGVYQVPEESVESIVESVKESVRIGKNQHRIGIESIVESVESPETIGKESPKESVESDYILSLKEQIEYLKQSLEEKESIIKQKDEEYRNLSIKMGDALLNAQKLNAIDKLPTGEVIPDDLQEKSNKKRNLLSRFLKKTL